MATLCKNCSHALVFNPNTQMLECSSCGSSFKPEDIEAESKESREDLKAEAASEVYGTDDKSLMDCYVYTCSECGGEIILVERLKLVEIEGFKLRAALIA